MRQLRRRVQRDFDRIADCAPVSSESWEQLRRRIAAEPDRTDEEVIMLTPTQPTPTRPRWAMAAAAALAVAAVVGLAGLIALRADDADSPTSDQPAAVDAFDPAVDDLCTRVTGDDLVAHLTAAGEDVEGPATPTTPSDDPLGYDCAWELASGQRIDLGARSYGQDRPDIPDNYEAQGQVMAPGGVPIAGHPELSDGVIVENQAFLRFSFFIVGTDRQLNITYVSDDVMCPEEGSCDEDPTHYETVLMRTADAILGDLGWLDD